MCIWGKRLAALLLTFTLGAGSSVFYKRYSTVSMCDIDANNGKYAGRTIRLHAYLSVENGYFAVCSVCGEDSVAGVNIPGAAVQLDPAQASSFHQGVHTRYKETGYVLYEVILVGTFEPPDGMLHCFSFKYHISNAHIERVLSVQEFPSSKELFDWFNSKSH